MPSDAVIISIITTVGGLILAYITKRFKNSRPKKKERVDEVLDIYEATIKRLNEENIRMTDEIRKLRSEKGEKV